MGHFCTTELRHAHMDQSKYLSREAILANCSSDFIKFASGRLNHYFEKLDDQLFKLAERAYNNEAQNRYFETINNCRRHRDAMQKLFLRHLEDSFDAFLRQQPLPDARRLAEHDHKPLSLVDQDDLEENIAISTLCRKAEAQYAEPLYALNQRLSVLNSRGKLAEEDNPLTPAVLSEAIRKAIAITGMETRAKLLVLKIFDNDFMAALGACYEHINQLLISNGILPNLRYQITHVSDSSSPRAALHGTEAQHVSHEVPPQALTPEGTSEFNQSRMLAAIQQVMLLRRGQPTAHSHYQPTYTAQELVQQLDLMQSQSAPALEQSVVAIVPLINPQQLSEQIKARHPQQPERNLDEIDGDTIEIVGLLFAYMLNLETLPDSVKAVLSHLHTPFLKVALLDKKFFNHPQHPARQLLNGLVSAGERWVNPDPHAKQEVFPQIRHVVQRVLKEFNNDLRLFTELALDFNHFVRQLEHRSRLAEQRATQAVQGQERLLEIRQDVSQLLAQKIGNQALPKPVYDLLYEAWSNYLAFILLRHGQQSEDWHAATKVVDDLLWYIQAKPSTTERQRASSLFSELEHALKKGFDTVGFDAERAQQILSSIKMCQRVATENAASASPSEPHTPRIAHVAHAQPEPANEQEHDMLERLKHIDFGTWFELRDEQSGLRRVKLAWYNANTSHYMFVNQMGQQVAVHDGLSLARALLADRARIVQQEDRPFFEKALERILSQLRGRSRD